MFNEEDAQRHQFDNQPETYGYCHICDSLLEDNHWSWDGEEKICDNCKETK